MSNPFFTLYQNAPESSLIEDLWNEAIYNMGFSGQYLPNVNGQGRDLIYGDDPGKKFDQAYTLDLYLQNSFDYGDQNDFFSKFGLEVHNQVKVLVAAREFDQKVGIFPRPREGDLIFIPFFKNDGELFEIKFTNTSKDLYVLGRKSPYYYELSLEPWKYNEENIDTGIPEIDAIEDLVKFKTSLDFISGYGTFAVGETVYQGTPESHIASGTVLSWNSQLSILVVTDITGEFSTTSNIQVLGETSDASYYLAEIDYSLEKSFDNVPLKEEGINYIDPSVPNSGSLSY